MGLINLGNEVDPVLTRLVDEDKVRWWKKPNLRLLYLLLYPTCMGIEITSGFDSQMINGLQLIGAWNKCSSKFWSLMYAGRLTIHRFWNEIDLRKRRSKLCCCWASPRYHQCFIQSRRYPRYSRRAMGSAEMGSTLVHLYRFGDPMRWCCPSSILTRW